MTNIQKYEKCRRVFQSCATLEQLRVAGKYMLLLFKSNTFNPWLAAVEWDFYRAYNRIVGMYVQGVQDPSSVMSILNVR